MKSDIIHNLTSIGITLAATALLIYLEIRLFYYLYNLTKHTKFHIAITESKGRLILYIGLGCFLLFHGKAFFEVLAVYKPFLQVYSYESSILAKILLCFYASITILFLCWSFYQDSKRSSSDIFIILFICYLAVLTLYTVQSSFRYYLIAYALAAIYLAYKIGAKVMGYKIILISTICSWFLIFYMQKDIFFSKHRNIIAKTFVIGNHQMETNTHFLPKEALLDSLITNKIENVKYLTENNYFLDLPIKFYKLSNPWYTDSFKSMEVSYSFDNYGSGYFIEVYSKKPVNN